MCGRLGLRGRIRVARDGVNVTVGGPMTSLRAHAAAVATHAVLGATVAGGTVPAASAAPAAPADGASSLGAGDTDLGALGAASGIDFKLAVSRGARNAATTAETGMDSLAVRLCEELVTLGPLARNRADPAANTAPHLTPQQFHQLLQRAAAAAEGAAAAAGGAAAADGAAGKASRPAGGVPELAAEAQKPQGAAGGQPGAGGGVVLLDARNVYETRIGHFGAGPAVPLLDPRTRCFSELPAWLDAHEAALAGRTVLMYCTGGVRCERASAYLREKGPAFAHVFQLSGGIQRYLEAYPDGGFFRGKNFLYDDRICVGPEAAPDAPAVGRCLLCGVAWDDYGERLRCSRCRLLLLVCDGCRAARQQKPPPLLCELCAAGGQQPPDGTAGPTAAAAAAAPEARMGAAAGIPQQALVPAQGRRLRILCLHGFRQSGKQFLGRTCSLRKKLRDLADFVFVDAPHTLPHFIKYDRVRSCRAAAAASGSTAAAADGEQEEATAEVAEKVAEEAPEEEAEAGAEGSAAHGHGEHGASPPPSPGAAPAPPVVVGLASPGRGAPVLPPGAARRAWLVSPQLLSSHDSAGADGGDRADGGDGAGAAGGWREAPAFLDEQQYTQQTEGWAESLASLRRAVREQGPFDGVFGFSQGAAVAAVLCALQQQHRDQQPQPPEPRVPDAGGDAANDDDSAHDVGFRFAILGSGFPSPAPDHVSLLQRVGPIRLPSLHVYGLAPQPPLQPQSPSAAAAATAAAAAATADAAATPAAAADTADAGAGAAASAAGVVGGGIAASGGGGCGGDSGDGRAGDRQIGEEASGALAAAFAPQQRRCLRHTAGHLIPATKPHAAAFRSFLSQFL